MTGAVQDASRGREASQLGTAFGLRQSSQSSGAFALNTYGEEGEERRPFNRWREGQSSAILGLNKRAQEKQHGRVTRMIILKWPGMVPGVGCWVGQPERPDPAR